MKGFIEKVEEMKKLVNRLVNSKDKEILIKIAKENPEIVKKIDEFNQFIKDVLQTEKNRKIGTKKLFEEIVKRLNEKGVKFEVDKRSYIISVNDKRVKVGSVNSNSPFAFANYMAAARCGKDITHFIIEDKDGDLNFGCCVAEFEILDIDKIIDRLIG